MRAVERRRLAGAAGDRKGLFSPRPVAGCCAFCLILPRFFSIAGIPTLIVLDPKGEVITRQGRVEVLNDVECREFPWHPKPVLELTDSNAVQLNEGPCLVLFVGAERPGGARLSRGGGLLENPLVPEPAGIVGGLAWGRVLNRFLAHPL